MRAVKYHWRTHIQWMKSQFPTPSIYASACKRVFSEKQMISFILMVNQCRFCIKFRKVLDRLLSSDNLCSSKSHCESTTCYMKHRQKENENVQLM